MGLLACVTGLADPAVLDDLAHGLVVQDRAIVVHRRPADLPLVVGLEAVGVAVDADPVFVRLAQGRVVQADVLPMLLLFARTRVDAWCRGRCGRRVLLLAALGCRPLFAHGFASVFFF